MTHFYKLVSYNRTPTINHFTLLKYQLHPKYPLNCTQFRIAAFAGESAQQATACTAGLTVCPACDHTSVRILLISETNCAIKTSMSGCTLAKHSPVINTFCHRIKTGNWLTTTWVGQIVLLLESNTCAPSQLIDNVTSLHTIFICFLMLRYTLPSVMSVNTPGTCDLDDNFSKLSRARSTCFRSSSNCCFRLNIK